MLEAELCTWPGSSGSSEKGNAQEVVVGPVSLAGSRELSDGPFRVQIDLALSVLAKTWSKSLDVHRRIMDIRVRGSVSSIFKRGGNKQETTTAPQQLAPEQQELDQKLDELEAVWSLPKQGWVSYEQLANLLFKTNSSTDLAKSCRTDMSVALWQEDCATFLVLVPRGKLLQHMGEGRELLGPVRIQPACPRA